MKKNVLVLFIIVLITPSIALASWWNPFSWYKQESSIETYDKSGNINELKNPSPEIQYSFEPKVDISTKEVEKEVKVPIIKTVVVQDANLQIRLNQLIEENKQLILKIQSLNNKISILEDEISELDDVKKWYDDKLESSKKATQYNLDNPEKPCMGTICP